MLHAYSKLLVLATFVLIIAGGLVTSTGSGLAVPDWPLSYGQWMPPMVGGVFFEHLHRMIAATVGFMTLILTIWIGISEKRRWLRWLGIIALAAVVTQGILGGMTVLFLLPAPISILHACLAQTFFALVVGISFLLDKPNYVGADPRVGPDLCVSPSRVSGAAQRPAPTFRQLTLTTTILIFVQLILGATLRHTHHPSVVIPHMMGAFIILLCVVRVLMVAIQNFRNEARIFIPTLILSALFICQIALGFGAWITTMVLEQSVQPTVGKVLFITGHQTLSAILLATSVFLILRTTSTSGWA
jgi:heme a synthase